MGMEVRRSASTDPSAGSEADRTDGQADEVCPYFHAAVELIGRRWTGAILWVLNGRSHYFAELTAAIPGLSDRLLSARLRELEAEGLVTRRVHAGSPSRVSYELTETGRQLEPALHEIDRWAKRHRADPDAPRASAG